MGGRMRIKKSTLNSLIAFCYNMPILFFQFFVIYDSSASDFYEKNSFIFLIVVPSVMLIISIIPMVLVLLEFKVIMHSKPELVIETTQSNRIGWLTIIGVNILGIILIIGFSGVWKLVVLGLMLLLNVLFWRSTKGNSGVYDSSLIYRGVNYPFEYLESCTVKNGLVTLKFIKPILFLEVIEPVELEGDHELERFLKLVFEKSDVLPLVV